MHVSVKMSFLIQSVTKMFWSHDRNAIERATMLKQHLASEAVTLQENSGELKHNDIIYARMSNAHLCCVTVQ